MTREEAIERLEFLKVVYSLDEETAIDMAIEALSNKAVSEDTPTKTELAHIKARLENVEKRLQGLANDVLIGQSRTG